MIEQFYLGCLAHASYLVHSNGAAAVIDPQRDVEIYLDFAQKNNLQIKYVILSHLHADFVSGHMELAERSGATVYIGAGSGALFPHVAANDGGSIPLGSCKLSFLQTPGHTVESICVVLTDPEKGAGPYAVFTGDTLFAGDVGRPDLSPNHTPQQLAALLYNSLHRKLMTLPDEVLVYPAHGAGSLCGKQLGDEKVTSIGKQRLNNYALQARTEQDFVALLTDSLPARPEYFEKDVELNRQGAAPLEDLPHLNPLTADEVLKLQSEGASVLDTRPLMQFAVAHVPKSTHIALSGQFASWAGRLIGLDTPIIIAGEEAEQVRESQLRLARVGIENVKGYLADGVAGWIRSGQPLEYIPQISPVEFKELQSQGTDLVVVDVREPGEFASGHIDGAINIPLSQLKQRTSEVDPSKLTVVHCKGGYRSSIATSLLRRAGIVDLANLSGGYDAWKAAQTQAVSANS